jgi:hypothetical protein
VQCRDLPEASFAGDVQALSMESTTSTERQEATANLRVGYGQLGVTYRAIDDFRAKLLGFLPAVTGGGLLLLSGKWDGLSEDLSIPMSVFGVVVSLGLLGYVIYGIGKCHELIKSGRTLEFELGLETGQFRNRSREVLGHIDEPFVAAILYSAAMAAWTYLAPLTPARSVSTTLAAMAFAIGCTDILRYEHVLRRDARLVFLRRNSRLRGAAP